MYKIDKNRENGKKIKFDKNRKIKIKNEINGEYGGNQKCMKKKSKTEK